MGKSACLLLAAVFSTLSFFQAGVWVGVLLVIGVIALIIWMVSRARGKLDWRRSKEEQRRFMASKKKRGPHRKKSQKQKKSAGQNRGKQSQLPAETNEPGEQAHWSA
jgi:hypothetical protein